MFRVKHLFVSTALILFFSVPAFAVPVNYGNFNGQTVVYGNVAEDSNTGDTPPLYFAPDIHPTNYLDFDPLAFASYSTSGGPADATNGLLTMTIQATPGNKLHSINLTGAGDYTLAGTNPMIASVQIGLGVNLTLLEVDGVPVPNVNTLAGATQTFLLSSGQKVSQPWNFGLGMSLAPIFFGLPSTANITKISLALDLKITATSAQGNVAFGAAKDFFITTATAAVPEPASAALLGIGLLGGLAARKRKQS